MIMLALLAPALGLAFRAWRERRRRDAVASSRSPRRARDVREGPVAPALFATTVLGFLAWQRTFAA
jgi:hypothetical protein